MSNRIDGLRRTLIRDMGGLLTDKNPYEIWVVTFSRINTKETRRLNRELGLSGLNNKGNYNHLKKDKL